MKPHPGTAAKHVFDRFFDDNLPLIEVLFDLGETATGRNHKQHVSERNQGRSRRVETGIKRR
jgi:hypothetical protein